MRHVGKDNDWARFAKYCKTPKSMLRENPVLYAFVLGRQTTKELDRAGECVGKAIVARHCTSGNNRNYLAKYS